jgi:RNA polymerase sigma-70 factor (ECF subfamily)
VNAIVVPVEEHILVQRAQQGDRQAFAVLVDRYWNRLYRWLYHLAHNRHQAEDLAQDAFLKAFAGLTTFRAGHSFQAWLFGIAHYGFLNQKRSNRKVLQVFPDEMESFDQGPLEQAMARETMKLLARAVGRLPTEFRAAFLLRVEEQLSFREIAEVLQITEETARWRVFKARQKLMENLAPQLDEEKP